jgi:hypothetical protein
MAIDPIGGVLTWTPAGADAGNSFHVEVIATDSGDPPATGRAEFSVTVLSAPQRPPVFQHLPAVLWLNDGLRSIMITATDPDGDPVSITADTSAFPGTVSFVAPAGTGTGTLTWSVPATARGVFTLPLTASGGGLATNATLFIRVEPADDYWRWAVDHLSGAGTTSDFGMAADPDGDGAGNVFEMTFLRDPLRADTTPLAFSAAGGFGPTLRIFDLHFRRHRASPQYVDLLPL